MGANLKKRLNNGERLIGVMINCIDTLDIVRIFRACGYDYVIIDNEHGAWTTPKISDMIAMCNEIDLGVIVRIPEAHRPYIQKYLDCGADGLMLPNCNDAATARKMVDYAKYEPHGSRGVSVLRGHCGYLPVADSLEFMRQKNDEILLIAQIETRKGLENVEEIMDVEGIDVALIGPNDLSFGLGIMGQIKHPLFIEATKRVVAAANSRGKCPAIQTTTHEGLREYMDAGFQMLLYGNEVLLMMNSAKASVKAFRDHDKEMNA